mmetsp:Transcript_24540/g.22295  ORF Transcript_24540/g.22295 Transcript_24540/m.22295 type:complete len:351 (+) Transcript_24540:38-1090(+)
MITKPNSTESESQTPDICYAESVESPVITMTHNSSQSFKTMIAGGIAGSTSKTLMAPLSRLVILFQVSSALPVRHSLSSDSISLLSAMKRIISEEGFLAFWKGNLTSVLHRFPYSAINFSVFELTKELLLELSSKKEETLSIRLISGAVGGGVACSVCYPLDLIRTRLTVDSRPLHTTVKSNQQFSTTPAIKQAGIVRTFADILRNEGFFGLYRGLMVSLSVCMPSLAVGFAAYGSMKEILLSTNNNLFIQDDSKRLTILGAMISGATSGILSSFLVYPADLVRRRMQVRGIVAGQKKPMLFQEITGIYKAQGVRGFYRGIVPELLKVTPTVGITFCVYEFVLGILDSKP